jgi:hypothetical protein
MASLGSSAASKDFFLISRWIAIMSLLVVPLQAGTVIEWFASDWPGAKSSWLSRTGGQTFFYDTYEGSAPVLGEDTLDGVAIKTAVFNGKDFLTTPLEQTDRPWAGIAEFSVTVVFRSKTPPAGASTDLNAFHEFKGILGFEVGGLNSGDFGIGIWNDGTSQGAVAAGAGLPSDVGISAGALNDDAWHIVTFLVTRQGKDTFALSVYADSRLVRTETRVTDTTGSNASSLADQPFSVGTIRSGKNGPFTGSIAAVRLDTTPLSAAEIEKLHRTYLGLKK